MKNIVLFTIFSCLSYSLIGQPSGINQRSAFQYLKYYDKSDAFEPFKISKYNKYAFLKYNLKNTSINLKINVADILKQRLDSILYYSGDTVIQKYKFSYDNNGNIIKEYTYVFDDSLVPVDLLEFTYDSRMNLTIQTRSEWNPLSLNWEKRAKEEYVYNENILVNHIFSRWIGASQNWEIYSYLEYKYNDNNRLERTNFYSTGETSELKNSSYKLYKYDPDGIALISEAYYDIFGTLYLLTTYSYDSNSKLIDKNTFEFINNSTTEYKTEYTYDEYERMILEVITRKRSGEEPENMYKREWIYNSNGDLGKYTFYLGSSDVSSWYPDTNVLFSYNTDFLERDLIFPFNINITEGFVEDGLDIRIFYHQIINESINGINAIYYYSPFDITGLTEIRGLHFLVYPNPANEAVTFKWPNEDKTLNLDLFQISGTLVFEQTVSNGKPVSIEQFENGVYIYKLSDGNKILYAGKLVLN